LLLSEHSDDFDVTTGSPDGSTGGLPIGVQCASETRVVPGKPAAPLPTAMEQAAKGDCTMMEDQLP
jgi:hypothetical protein